MTSRRPSGLGPGLGPKPFQATDPNGLPDAPEGRQTVDHAPAGRLAALRAECLELLASIAAHVDDHFGVLPDEADWGHVGDAERVRAGLRDLSDGVAGAGEYAPEAKPA